MILVASMEEPEVYRAHGVAWDYKARFEALTGVPVLYAHYSEVNPDFVGRHDFRAIFITGFGYGWELVPPAAVVGISDVLHTTELPVLGACGGHQLIGNCFNHAPRRVKGFRNEYIRRLRPGEPDVMPDYYPGYFCEVGMHDIQVLCPDPIFDGLPNPFRVRESHSCEIKKLPHGFIHLARNDNCEIQCIRHHDRPIYGAQFHSEHWTDAYPHGRVFIANFLRIAGLIP
jgi:GMP synthase-like glutamine amidotransferase